MKRVINCTTKTIYQDLSLQDIKGEEWRDIEGLKGYYMASNMGRIKSLYRRVWRESQQCYISVRERILSQSKKKCQSMQVRLQAKEIDYSSRSHGVNTLVANAFIPNKTNARYVFHKDLDFKNNIVSNLYREEVQHLSEIRQKIKNKQIGKRRKSAKFISTPSKYRGVTKQEYYLVQIIHKEINLKIAERFTTELEAAHQYDYYIKKYNLKRKGNFI